MREDVSPKLAERNDLATEPHPEALLAVGLNSLRLLMDNTHDCLIVCNDDGAIIFWNRTAEELFGWTSLEAQGQRPELLLKSKFPIAIDQVRSALSLKGQWQ